MKDFLIFLFTIVIIGVVGYAGYIAYDYLKDKNSLQFEPLPSPDEAAANSTLLYVATSTDQVIIPPDTTSWKTYSDDEMGYSIKYPPEIIKNTGVGSVIFAFPKNTYFHWPLLDEARVTVSASSTCGRLPPGGKLGDTATTSTVRVGQNEFVKDEVNDIGAGVRYTEIAFDQRANGVCYRIVYFNRGSNGTGSFVTDPILAEKYGDQHAADLEKVMSVVYGMLGSFRILETPEGVSEEDFN